MMSESSWLVCPHRLKQAKRRLFCFPFAGGGASVYFNWSRRLSEFGTEVLMVQLPGRESRINEMFCDDIQEVVSELILAMEPYCDIPFSFFGHSMGSVIAYELAWTRQQQFLPLPDTIFLSGRNPPFKPVYRKKISQLPYQAFVQEMIEFGNLPDTVLNEPDLMEIIVPIMRADISMLDKHQTTSQAKLTCGLVILGGQDDPWTTEHDLWDWQRHATMPLRCKIFPGDHFFIRTHESAVIQTVHENMMD